MKNFQILDLGLKIQILNKRPTNSIAFLKVFSEIQHFLLFFLLKKNFPKIFPLGAISNIQNSLFDFSHHTKQNQLSIRKKKPKMEKNQQMKLPSSPNYDSSPSSPSAPLVPETRTQLLKISEQCASMQSLIEEIINGTLSVEDARFLNQLNETSMGLYSFACSVGGKQEPSRKKRKKALQAPQKQPCRYCQRTEVTQWRRGPDGYNSLCNSCGLHYSLNVKKEERLQHSPIMKIPVNALLNPEDNSKISPTKDRESAN